MQTIPEVEQAKAVMVEAAEWSVVCWLREKKKVRKLADVANAALDRRNAQIKAEWPQELRQALAQNGNGESATFLKQVRSADEAARRARQDAEDTFDEAERTLSARLAREGSRKAILSWELHEKAIRKAEAALK